jgi:hypothetical protein
MFHLSSLLPVPCSHLFGAITLVMFHIRYEMTRDVDGYYAVYDVFTE